MYKYPKERAQEPQLVLLRIHQCSLIDRSPESSFLSSAPVCALIAYLASVAVKILSDSAVATILLSLCLVSIAFNVALLYSSRRYFFPCISRPSPPASAVA